MSLRRFNPGCACCCFKELVLIAIYDESSSYLPPFTQQYFDHRTIWEDWIDSLTISTVRAGIIVPHISIDLIRPEAERLPYDSDRPEWDVDVIGFKNPRVEAEDIISMFERLRTSGGSPAAPVAGGASAVFGSSVFGGMVFGWSDAAEPVPDTILGHPETGKGLLLQFVLDDSGSINVRDYEDELEAAKATLQTTYPKLKILDDVSETGEAWLLDSKQAAEDEVCG